MNCQMIKTFESHASTSLTSDNDSSFYVYLKILPNKIVKRNILRNVPRSNSTVCYLDKPILYKRLKI